MFRNVLYLFGLMLLVSCQDAVNESVESSEEPKSQPQNDLFSELRSEDQLSKDSIYKDTLVFSHFADEYDYWYAVFQLNESSEIYLVYDDPISDKLAGSSFAIEWKMSEFFEAGESDSLYYAEELLSYEIVEQSISFEGYLRDFVKAYSRTTDDLIWDFVHEEVGLHAAYNPGAMCIESKVSDIELSKFISWDCVIAEGYPKGDFCEGYAGAEEGFYFEEIQVNSLPKFADMSGDEYVPYTPELPIASEVEAYQKVLVIAGEWNYRFLTFFKHQGNWYFWIEDLCDCSA